MEVSVPMMVEAVLKTALFLQIELQRASQALRGAERWQIN